MAAPGRTIRSHISPVFIGMLFLLGLMSFVVWNVGVYVHMIFPGIRLIIGILFIVLPLSLLCTAIATRKIHNRLLSFLYIIGALWFPLLIYLFMAAVVVSLLILISSFGIEIPVTLCAQILTIVSCGALVWGVINSYCIRITKYVVTSKELADRWGSKKIILFSDTHIGIVRGARFMKKVVQMIQNLSGDLVFLAGDVIDGPVFDYVKGLAPLGDISAPLIYTPGNHEGYNQEPEKFYPVIEALTQTLVDKKITLYDTQIIGLTYQHETDEETRERLYRSGYDQHTPSIVIMHDPTHSRVLENENVSLIVSGHTHKGQFFPATLFMKRLYKEFAYGINIKGKTTAITTSGVGTTLAPLRLGSNPEIVVISFKKE
jgi:predicted MPP superfamily phosphohydrolase